MSHSFRFHLVAALALAAFTVLAAPSALAGSNPVVTSIARLQPGPLTTSDSVTWRVTFNESVTGVDGADFALTTVTGSAAGVISAVSGAGAEYVVAVTALRGIGTLRLDVRASGTGISDHENLALAGGFTFGQSYTHIRSSIPVAWGRNVVGGLGDGTRNDSRVPVTVTTSGVLLGKTVVAVAAGGGHSMALTSDGRVYAWGANDWGQLGITSPSYSKDPIAVPMAGALAGKTVIAIAAGWTHSLALTSDGQIFAWGWNGHGELGNGTKDFVVHPTPGAVITTGVLLGKTVVAIAAGSTGNLALASDGQVYAWGDNILGELGSGSVTEPSEPVAVTTSGVLSGKIVVAIAAGGQNGMALTSEGTICMWGSNYYGQLGIGSADGDSHPAPSPVPPSGVLSGKTVVAIAAGKDHCMALTSEGQVCTWGANRYGQLGNGSTSYYSSPTPQAVLATGALSGRSATAIAAGMGFSQALTSSGAFYTWGDNYYGELGDDSTTDCVVPVAVVTASGTGSALAGRMIYVLSAANCSSYHVVALALPLAVGSAGVPTAGWYGEGDALAFTVNFAQAVNVSTTVGTPRIALTIGSATRYATYASGSGTTALTFSFLVRVGDSDSDGITVASTGVDLNGGSVTDLLGNVVDLALPPLDTSGIRIGGAAPEIITPPGSVTVQSGDPVNLSVVASGSGALAYQWSRGGVPVAGATASTLAFASIGSSEAGLYDVQLFGSSGDTLSAPVVVGVVPSAGQRTAGAVTTRTEWQDVRNPGNGYVYDQFLLTGASGTFTADAGQIARMSYLDDNGSIVQVEMSGAGAITVNLANATGPMAPALYNQSGIHYMKGKATIILAGADATTHFTIYSVGTATNPGVTRSDVTYAGWADVAAAGIISTDGALGGIHQGNANYNAALGYTGIYAPNVTTVGGAVVVHGIASSATAQPYLYFGPGGSVKVKIAGSDLAQPSGDSITVGGLAEVQMGAGQDSCGRGAPAQAIQGRLANDAGTDVTGALVVGP